MESPRKLLEILNTKDFLIFFRSLFFFNALEAPKYKPLHDTFSSILL